MTPRLHLPLLALVCAVLAAAPLAAAEIATSVSVPEPAFYDPVVKRADEPRSGFELQLTRDMPTPGWRFDIESVHVDEGRIHVELSEGGPEGISAQVITRTRCTIAIGELAPGRYVLELWLPRNGTGDHYPAQVLFLQAS